MKLEVEPYYMNELSFSLRAAAHDVYVFENIDNLVKMRFGKVSDRYLIEFSLTAAQWQEVLDTAILTRLSQTTLGKHLAAEELIQLDYLLRVILNLQELSVAEVEEELAEAPKLQAWYQNLRKLMRNS